MKKTETTPSAATGKAAGRAFGDDLGAVAARVQRRVWHLWRARLGRSEVFLPAPGPEQLRRSVTDDAWSDLHRTIVIALRRGGTESELVELLTSNVIRYDQRGAVVFKATNVGRLAGYRLWQFINTKGDTPGYRKVREVPQAAHVTWWDQADREDRERARTGRLQAQADQRRRELARSRREAARKAELYDRWRLDRANRPEPSTAETEPEHRPSPSAEARANIRVQPPVDQAEPEQQRERPWTYTPRSKDAHHQAALARARAEKRARRHGEQQ
jgi:hypothetical protein